MGLILNKTLDSGVQAEYWSISYVTLCKQSSYGHPVVEVTLDVFLNLESRALGCRPCETRSFSFDDIQSSRVLLSKNLMLDVYGILKEDFEEFEAAEDEMTFSLLTENLKR